VMESQYCACQQENRRGRGVRNCLVNHHHRQQIADRREEHSIEVVVYRLTDLVGEGIQQNLAHGEEKHSKGDITQRPPILQCPQHQQDLTAHVDEQEQRVDNIHEHEERRSLCRVESSVAVEGADGDRACEKEHHERADAHQPDGESSAVFVDLEADEAIDQEAGARRGGQSGLRGDEIGIRLGADRDHAGVEA